MCRDNDSPEYLAQCSADTAEFLEDLARRIGAGEIKKGAVRLLMADGSIKDVVFGAETPEEGEQMLAMLHKQMDGVTEH